MKPIFIVISLPCDISSSCSISRCLFRRYASLIRRFIRLRFTANLLYLLPTEHNTLTFVEPCSLSLTVTVYPTLKGKEKIYSPLKRAAISLTLHSFSALPKRYERIFSIIMLLCNLLLSNAFFCHYCTRYWFSSSHVLNLE